MSMGLTCSPDKFQEVMDEVLHNNPNCYVYLDNILICANDEKTHLKNIAEILNRNRHFGIKIFISKCQFAQPSAHYLGFVLDSDEIHPNPEKMKTVIDKTTPRTYKEVESFLGAASYFRRHIRYFSAIVEPLYKLDKSFLWKDIHGDAFKKLKDALIIATTLSPPDNTKNYTIFTDASFQGLGAALVQQDKPIAFAPRSLKPAEKNYPIIKLEALELIYALKQFRLYIYGKHTLVITDHKQLWTPTLSIDKFIQFYNEKENEIISNTGKIRTPSNTRIYVPHQSRERLLETFHKHPVLGEHLSFDKMNGRFKSIFYWSKMNSQMLTSW
uniref:RNA-directed DNA polymerase n=1 Tax=Strongyloides venezuelensis TaxID=75913 RepID=A0A0K0FZA1_STRVS